MDTEENIHKHLSSNSHNFISEVFVVFLQAHVDRSLCGKGSESITTTPTKAFLLVMVPELEHDYPESI